MGFLAKKIKHFRLAGLFHLIAFYAPLVLKAMKVYVETYGCAANQADSHLMQELLSEAGHSLVSTPMEADVIVLNTCTVRLETELRMVRRIKELLALGKRLIVAGCLASAQPGLIRKISPEISMVSARAVERIVEAVEAPSTIYLLRPSPRRRLPSFVDGVKFVVPIAEGCRGSCTYCIVRVARGPLRSYSADAIVEAVKGAVSRGAREIRLTAQDTASYGADTGTTLPKLLRRVCSVEGEFRVRVGMMNPDSAMSVLDELVEAFKHPKVYKFLHIPVQSGDNEILKLMGRRYTTEEFKAIVEAFRSEIPSLSVATDIIVGFPGEDEEAFKNTLKLVEEVRPDRVHVARYTPRPHTRAAALPQVPEPVKKSRSRLLVKVCNKIALEFNRGMVGQTLNCLVVGTGPKSQLEARTPNYKPVYLNGCTACIGKFLQVRIVDAGVHYLKGEPEERSKPAYRGLLRKSIAQS